MSKIIAYDHDALEAIKRGVGTLARAVTTTLGPRGRNVLLQKSYGPPLVTKDGVTVAKEIDLEDPFENIGARMVREVASKTNDVAGDGTTTATILAKAIFDEGLRAVTAGVNPIALKQGIEKAVQSIVRTLHSNSVPINGKEDLVKVASIAANNDPSIGRHVAEALDRVGKDGVVTLDEGRSTTTEMEWVEGMQFDKGYLSPYFVTDATKMECVLDDPYVLVHEKKISNIKDIVPILEKVVQSGKPLLIIADDVEGEALATLVVNRLRGTFQCCAVKAPGYGDRRKAMMEDIAVLTGGKAIFESLGIKLETLPLDNLGRAEKVVVDRDNTTIIQGAGGRGEIDSRIAQIKLELDKSESSYDREKLEERMAKLTNGVAKINVGAATESELKEKKFLYEDAINAAKAAADEGILAGGGVALLRAAQACQPDGLNDDETVGFNIVRKACRWPLKCIAENAGRDGSLICEKVAEMSGNKGYNAMTDAYEDLVATGVIDPTKVVRSELENAASVATLLLTSDALIAEKPKKESNGSARGGDYDMY
ncbi:chaperonin GroEL [Roseiconus nitratireducens]|uniref:Chaperonin GroEL n=1 Tax=Roseiconus nitratireducens TaxID=2605748 RepID=A0A5M6D8M8_9BACT|nr:chaperonin GroEL [Roseiconus nitratireducens]KAA5542672.1 chaperonin GroEL [Roseiconus nitratireducens]